MYNRDNQGGAMARRPQSGLSGSSGSNWLRQRGDPWQEMQEMQRRVDQLFARVFGQEWPAFPAMGAMMSPMANMGVAEPDIDFAENETEYTIQAALPGIAPEDIDVQATEDSIRLVAQTRSSEPSQQQQGSGQSDGSNGDGGQAGSQQAQGQKTQHRQGEFSRVSRFEFAYSLPEEIIPGEITANFRHGVLELRLPKARPNGGRSKAISIPIQGANSTARISGGGSAKQDRAAQPGTDQASDGAEHRSSGRNEGDGSAKRTTGRSGQSRANAAGSAAKSK